MGEQVGRGERHFPFGGLREVAGGAVQEHAERQAASASSSWPSQPAIMPVSTSPVPPVAMPGVAGRIDEHAPSGVAIIVRWPFSTTYTWCVSAKLRATSTRFAWTSSVGHARRAAPSRPDAA